MELPQRLKRIRKLLGCMKALLNLTKVFKEGVKFRVFCFFFKVYMLMEKEYVRKERPRSQFIRVPS